MKYNYLVKSVVFFLLLITSIGCGKSSPIIASPVSVPAPTPISIPTPTPSYIPVISAKSDSIQSRFKTVGELATFRWIPPNSTTGFEYDLYYYIPKSVGLHPELPAKSIVMMHGGGTSTLTREGSTWAVSLYVKDFIKIADEQNLIVVFPSGSGLNWGGHTRTLIREVAKLMRQELPIDPNSIALFGHSMGGMGITRNAFFLGDQFAFIMPCAAGMDPVYMTDFNLLTLFNVPYHHIQGLHDSFEEFVVRAKLHAEKMKALESKLGISSPFELTLTETGHKYDLSQLKEIIKTQFEKSTRNLYQRDLYGSFFYANTINTENNIPFNYTSTPDYFWLEAHEFSNTEKAMRSPFEAHITGNQIWIEFKGSHNLKTLRIYLSKKMITFRKPISIMVNGIRKFRHFVSSSSTKTTQTITAKRDTGFVFDQYIDIDVSDSQTPQTKSPE